MFIFDNLSTGSEVRNVQVIYARKPEIKVNSFKTLTREYLIHTLLNQVYKGNVVKSETWNMLENYPSFILL